MCVERTSAVELATVNRRPVRPSLREDFQPAQLFDGLRIENPFLSTLATLDVEGSNDLIASAVGAGCRTFYDASRNRGVRRLAEQRHAPASLVYVQAFPLKSRLRHGLATVLRPPVSEDSRCEQSQYSEHRQVEFAKARRLGDNVCLNNLSVGDREA